MGKAEIRTPLSEKEKDGFRPEERAGGVRVEMWERQLNMQSSCYVPSPVLGGFIYVTTYHLHNPESIIVPTVQMGKEVIETLLDAFHIRILELTSNLCCRHSFSTKWQCWNSTASGTKKPRALGLDVSSPTFTLGRKWLWGNNLISEPQFTCCKNENDNTCFAELFKRVNEITCEISLAHSNHAIICWGDRCHGIFLLKAIHLTSRVTQWHCYLVGF